MNTNTLKLLLQAQQIRDLFRNFIQSGFKIPDSPEQTLDEFQKTMKKLSDIFNKETDNIFKNYTKEDEDIKHPPPKPDLCYEILQTIMNAHIYKCPLIVIKEHDEVPDNEVWFAGSRNELLAKMCVD